MLATDLLGVGTSIALEHHLLALEYAGVSLHTVWWTTAPQLSLGALLFITGAYCTFGAGTSSPLSLHWGAYMRDIWGGVTGVANHPAAILMSPRTWLVWIPESLDFGLLAAELALVGLCLRRALTSGFVRALGRTSGYDTIALFCQARGVALTEVAVVTTLFLGVVIFDAVVVLAEDDALEALCYLLAWLVGLTFLLLWVGVDLQYVYMVCAVGGQPSWRLLYMDIVNNVLAIFRVVFCWVRYLFYDLQTEALDFATHATALGGSTSWDLQTEAATLATPVYWVVLGSWVGAVILDCGWWLVQLVLGVVKMALALALFGVITDLFIVRAAAWSELRSFKVATQRTTR